MKRLTTLSLSFLSMMTFAQGIKFEENNFNTLLKKAKQENKLIFIDAYTTWCGPCKLMAKNIFTLKSVGDYYNEHFINAKFDMEKGEGITIAKKYHVNVFPSYLFINGDGEEVHRTLGYVEEQDFIQFAKDAENPDKRLTALKKQFEEGKSDQDFLKNLADLTIYSDPKFAEKVLDKYFSNKTNFDAEDMQMLLTVTRSSNSPLYKVFQAKKEDILKLISEDRYNTVDKNLKLQAIVEKAYNENTKSWNDTYFMAETQSFLTKDDAIKALKKIKASYALKNKDYKTYEQIILDLYSNPVAATSEELNSIAWNFFENINNKSSLEKAVKWAQESVSKKESYANTDTLANLYNKVGDKNNAKKWAQRSIELAKINGEDYTQTEQLLKTL